MEGELKALFTEYKRIIAGEKKCWRDKWASSVGIRNQIKGMDLIRQSNELDLKRLLRIVGQEQDVEKVKKCQWVVQHLGREKVVKRMGVIWRAGRDDSPMGWNWPGTRV